MLSAVFVEILIQVGEARGAACPPAGAELKAPEPKTAARTAAPTVRQRHDNRRTGAPLRRWLSVWTKRNSTVKGGPHDTSAVHSPCPCRECDWCRRAAVSDGVPYRCRAWWQRHREGVEQVRDERVVAAERNQLDHALLAKQPLGGVVCLLTELACAGELARHGVDGALVVGIERWVIPAADGIDDSVAHPVLAGHPGVRPPLEFGLPGGAHGDDRQLAQAAHDRCVRWQDELSDVSCGGSDRIAVGFRTVDGKRRTLAELWNGSARTIIQTPK